MNIFDKFLGLLAPHNCLVCTDEDFVLCYDCASQIDELPSSCYICHKATTDFAPCSEHATKKSPKHIWFVYSYEKTIKKLLWAYKFQQQRAGALDIANIISGILPNIPPDTIVTYVPTSPEHIRQRGFDHSKLIAVEISKILDLPCHSLLKRNPGAVQHTLNRKQRLAQIKNSYSPINNYLTVGATILLIDDVVTTGATISECTKQLYLGGAKIVNVATLARTPK